MVVVVFGLPGSGKSYFAGKLASRINADYLNSDRLRKETLMQRTYSEPEKVLVYDEIIKRVNIKQDISVVVDATFYKKHIRDRFINSVATKHKVFFIEVAADEELIRERLKLPRTNSDADFEIYEKIKEQWEPMQEPHLVLQSTNDNIEQLLVIALKYLGINNDQQTNQ